MMKKSSRSEVSLTSARERARAATEDALLTAAEEVFSERGLGNARVEDIAARAGVAVGTLYNYFDGIPALLASLNRRRHAELKTRFEALASGAKARPFREELDLFLRTALAHLDAHRRFFAIVFQAEAAVGASASAEGAGEPTAMDEVYARAEDVVRKGVREGALAPNALAPAVLIGLVRATLVHERYAPVQGPLTELATPLADIFLGGMPRGAKARGARANSRRTS